MGWLTLSCSSNKIIIKHQRSGTMAASPSIEVEAIEVEEVPSPVVQEERLDLQDYCKQELAQIPGSKIKHEEMDSLCTKVRVLPNCKSENGLDIFHYEKIGKNNKDSKKILTLSLIHGDEGPSGTVSSAWMSRLEGLDSRNTWRVIPIANPDGFKNKTRMNSRGVDLNRNFPSEDWEHAALEHWKKAAKSDPRKFPGASSASEAETRCLVQHIEDFQPDFIISVHTPFGVLDFDGPRMNFPVFKPLPWIALGNYPGSLGRYMWVNNKVPVLTIELKGNEGLQQLELFDRLQDISGTVAIQATKILNSDTKAEPKKN